MSLSLFWCFDRHIWDLFIHRKRTDIGVSNENHATNMWNIATQTLTIDDKREKEGHRHSYINYDLYNKPCYSFPHIKWIGVKGCLREWHLYLFNKRDYPSTSIIALPLSPLLYTSNASLFTKREKVIVYKKVSFFFLLSGEKGIKQNNTKRKVRVFSFSLSLSL